MYISVIIPVYNNEKYLAQCIQSIENQTIVSDVEIICVDDGSREECKKELRRLEREFDNIRVLQQSNSGSGVARNNGIRNAHGDYLMFIDSDDFLCCNDALERLFTVAKRESVELVCGNINRVINGKIISVFEPKRKYSSFKHEGYIDIKKFQYPYAHQRYLFSRNFLINNGIYYPDNIRGQDVVFCAEALSKATNLYHINYTVYQFRENHKELKYDYRRANAYVDSLLKTIEIAKKSGWNKLIKQLYDTLRVFALNYWYSILEETETWNEVAKVNEYLCYVSKETGVRYRRLLNKDEFQSRNYRYQMERIWCLKNKGIDYCIRKVIWAISPGSID